MNNTFIPTYPITISYNITQVTDKWELQHNDTVISINNKGLIEINGNIKDAARAFLKEIIRIKATGYQNGGITFITIQYTFGCFTIDLESELNLIYKPDERKEIPTIFFELKKEFDKIKHLIVFW